MPRPKRLLSLAAAALALTSAALVNAAPALAHGNQETLFQDDVQLKANPYAFMQKMADFGVDRVRVFVTWRDIAPSAKSKTKPRGFNATDPASYSAAGWNVYDQIDRAAAQYGIGLDFTPFGPSPYWAAHGGPSNTNGVWEPSAHEFGSFVTAVARRYDGTYDLGDGSGALPKVSYWGIWNEPNYGVALAPQTTHGPTLEVAPRIYRGLVDAAWSALHAQSVHAHDTILIGELAPRGQTYGGMPGTSGGMVPIRFIRALYCVDSRNRPLTGRFASDRGCPTNSAGSRQFYRQHPGLFDATGFSDHPYPQGGTPLQSTWPNGGANLYTDWTQLPALERLLDAVQRTYGRGRHYAIYNTEFGDQIPRVSQSRAALYLNWFEYLSSRSSRLVTYDQYLLRDPAKGNFPTGLEDSRGRALATYDAFRMPLFLPVTSTRRGHSLEVWGAARAAKFGTGSDVSIQFQANSRGSFKTVKSFAAPGGRGYFDTRIVFPGSGSVRLEWTPLGGKAIHSRVEKITVR